MRLAQFFISWKNLFSTFFVEMKAIFSVSSLKEFIALISHQYNTQVAQLRNKLSDLRSTNINLALHHFNDGSLSDAIFRFKLVKRFYPDCIAADYYIGRAFIEQNQLAKALPYLSDYLASDDQMFREEAMYCYHIATKKLDQIKEIPASIVARIFDQIAPIFNELFFKEEDSYDSAIMSMVNQYFISINSHYANNMLDLGCGTGKISELLKRNKVVSHITGIDISTNMLNICRSLKVDRMKVFDELLELDINKYCMQQMSDTKYKIILASQSLSFIGDLNNFMCYLTNALADNGVAVLMFRAHIASDPKLMDTTYEEFTYNAAYIKELAATNKLNIYKEEKMKFRNGDMYEIMLLIKG